MKVFVIMALIYMDILDIFRIWTGHVIVKVYFPNIKDIKGHLGGSVG